MTTVRLAVMRWAAMDAAARFARRLSELIDDCAGTKRPNTPISVRRATATKKKNPAKTPDRV
jgi:hypothetical protein